MSVEETRISKERLPVTPINPRDLHAIAEMLRAYPFYLYLTFPASPQREKYLRSVGGLSKRLAKTYQENTPIPLTMEEITTIEAAMEAFEMIMTAFAPKTRGILATIDACMHLRQRIALMNSCSPVRFLN